jgi:hypothetical protein
MGGETRSPRNLEPQYNEGAARSPAQSVTAHGIDVREDTKRHRGEGLSANQEGFVVLPATYPARPATYLARAATYPAASEGFVVLPATFASRLRLSRADGDFLGRGGHRAPRGRGGDRRSMVHDAAGIGRSMIHDAAGIVGSMIHDAAGCGRLMIHDAAGCGRIADHDAPGGLTPTPAMPGMGRPRGFGTTWHHRGVMRAWWRDAAIIAHRSPQRPERPQVPRSVGRFRRGGS